MASTGAVRPSLPHRPSSGRLDGAELRDRIEKLVRSSVPRAADAWVDLAVACADAFVVHGGDPVTAGRSVAARCLHFGETQAQAGMTDDELTAVVQSVGRGLRRQVIPAVVREQDLPDVETLSRAVQELLLRIVGHVRRGMQTVLRLHALSPVHRRRALTAALFGGSDGPSLRGLAIACGIDPTVRLTPVVATAPGAVLDAQLRGRDDVLPGPRPQEAAVPAAWSDDRVRALADVDVARGPSVDLVSLPEAVRLTRTTAAVAVPGTPVTASVDVLARLVVASSPVLVDLLIGQRLAPLADLPASRRSSLASTLLAWLEHGRPANEVARMMGVPAQTVHMRLGTAKRLLGDPLTDPDVRLELLVALRAAVPRWELETR